MSVATRFDFPSSSCNGHASVCHSIDTHRGPDRVYISTQVMGTPTPDHESAHDHELVTDDELLEDEGPSITVEAATDDDPSIEWAFEEPVEPAPRRMPVRVGEVLAGKYRVERIHAPGALGLTCDAEHLQLHQRVVVKLCGKSVGAGARSRSDAATRFLQNARLSAQLRNPHLARVIDLGTLDSGIAYSVTEHLSGTDLRGVLRVREWLPVSEAIDYTLQVCEALAVVHVAGHVHRNLKPANVFLARESDGRPTIKVLDPCLVDGMLSDTSIAWSTTESTITSLAYLSPEQVRDPASVDVRADIWAIGALLHELITGTPLHSAASVPGLFAAIAADSPIPICQLREEVPSELEEIVLRCLEKEREYRWSDVGTLAKQLARFASEEGRDTVDRVILVLERHSRSPRSLRPAAQMKKAEAAPRSVALALRPNTVQAEVPQSRRLLELGLAALAIMGVSVGVGAFMAIHSLQAVLAARSDVARPVVASLSPALPAAAQTAPGSLPVASVVPPVAPAVPVVAAQPATQPVAVSQPVAVAAPRAITRPASAPRSEPAVTSAVPHPIINAEPTSAQALFDNAN